MLVSLDRVPRMPHCLNSGCSRHVPAGSSSTPSKSWRLPPRLESTPGLKLISLPLHNNAAASPKTSCLRLRRTRSALWGWAPEPHNSDYLHKSLSVSHFARCAPVLPKVETKHGDHSEAPMPTGGGCGEQELGMEDRWQLVLGYGRGRGATPPPQDKVTLDQSADF